MDYISLGSVPYNESCAQVGSSDYYERMKKEAKAYINQLYRIFTKEFPRKDQAKIIIRNKSFSHDFGSYHEVCAIFNEWDSRAREQAMWLENHTPGDWDEEARKELGEEYFKELEEV